MEKLTITMPVGINPWALKGLIQAVFELFTAIKLEGKDENNAITGFLGFIYANFYASTGISYEKFMIDMRYLLKDVFIDGEMEGM
ncbi:MAG: hypothetical protein K9H48_17570 [Melioribacteraceae bacterium]|nr:hypothetical protein [Melioribacteraceae bacterium]MCF8395713.1 hypothetical protein [Melioribacteraceae bacterium]MCF8421215.1 hypothetical protein [Melioribacteraceae bacterium]